MWDVGMTWQVKHEWEKYHTLNKQMESHAHQDQYMSSSVIVEVKYKQSTS